MESKNFVPKSIACLKHVMYIVNTTGELGIVKNFDNNKKMKFSTLQSENPICQVISHKNRIYILDVIGNLWKLQEKQLEKCNMKENLFLNISNTSEAIFLQGLDSNLYNIENICLMEKVKYISCGKKHILIISENNTLWSQGNNKFGQLGLGDYNDRLNFTQIKTNESCIQIACGLNHSLYLGSSYTVYSCGDNSFGQLGISSDVSKSRFEFQIVNMFVLIISCSHNNSFFTYLNKNLFACGESFRNGSLIQVDIPKLNYTTAIWSIQKINYITSNWNIQKPIIQDIEGKIWQLNGNEAKECNLIIKFKKSKQKIINYREDVILTVSYLFYLVFLIINV